MSYFRTAVALSLLAFSSAHAEDTTKIMLTGNPSADFFPVSNTPLALFSPSPFPGHQEGSPSNDGRKSPFLAALMSFVVPGAGEVYAGDYVKGAAIFTTQMISIGAAINYSNKGHQQDLIDQAYANAHWSATRYINWTLDNLPVLNPGDLTTAAQYRQKIFINGDTTGSPPPFRNVDWAAMNAMEVDVGNGVYNGYAHWLFPYGTGQYYKELGKYDQFSAGWDDGISGSLSASDLPLSYESPHFVIYRAMRAEADRLNSVSNTWVAITIVEHFLSAVDAFWSAHQFNNSLHADLHMYMAPTPDGLTPTTELTVSYSLPQ